MKQAEADLLVQTTKGTQMGDYLRDHWVPVMRSERVEADGAPQQVRLFGDNFVVFRGSDGKVGIVDEACPHRGASLALARNVDCELQCLYHGWHVARDGGVTAAPTERDREEFGDRIKTNKYPVNEISGLIWGYFGPQAEAPTFPMFEWNLMDTAHVHAKVAYVNANWLQILEGVFDPMHVGILHSAWLLGKGAQTFQIVCDIDLVERDYGLTALVTRSIPGEDVRFARVKEFAKPFFGFVPMPAGDIHTCIVPVPADDEHTHMWYIHYDTEATMENFVHNNSHMSIGFENGMMNSDNFREPMPTDRENLWGQNRERMADGHPTGLMGLVLEDIALLESQGPVQDRTREHLGRSDRIVTRMRRMLLAASADHQAHGRADDSALDHAGIRAMAAILHPGMSWEEIPRYVGDFPEGYHAMPSLRPTRPEPAGSAPAARPQVGASA